VEYDTGADLATVADDLFQGNLTGTVHAASGEQTPALRSLVPWIAQHAGRVLFGGWPTGVAVTPAMQHGGPWPATTNDSGTSVGTAAISRFLRPVAYQGAPQELLPEPLRDDNPWNVPQHRSPAGQSQTWCAAART
jgi:NADP-dependent aldehyde dehydrogenase